MALPIDHIALTQEAFNKLPEYSSSVPTGTTIGKQWKAKRYNRKTALPDWWMGEYVKHTDPKMVGISWKKIVIREAGLKASEVVGVDDWGDMYRKEREASKAAAQ